MCVYFNRKQVLNLIVPYIRFCAHINYHLDTNHGFPLQKAYVYLLSLLCIINLLLITYSRVFLIMISIILICIPKSYYNHVVGKQNNNDEQNSERGRNAESDSSATRAEWENGVTTSTSNNNSNHRSYTGNCILAFDAVGYIIFLYFDPSSIFSVFVDLSFLCLSRGLLFRRRSTCWGEGKVFTS